jgi:intracellular sulfur oxidation DsrE/DsrF family protein
MLRNFLLLGMTVLLFWLAAALLLREPPGADRASDAAPVPALEPIAPPGSVTRGYWVADINVHSVAELELLFGQVEQRVSRPRSGGEEALVSLVLHGPEVEFFALKNYDRYKAIVDRAAKLAALGAVDISICQTQMRQRGIGSDEVPAFLRQVPYGPGEVERLLQRGYVTM